jgi:hypothetical protein
VISSIHAICAVHPHPQDVRAGSPKSHTAESGFAGLVGCRGDLSQGSENDRRLDAAWWKGLVLDPRMKHADFSLVPGAGRVPALRGLGYVSSGLCICSRRCARLAPHECFLLQSLDGRTPEDLVQRGMYSTVVTARAAVVVRCSARSSMRRRHSTRLPRAPSQCPLTQGGALGGEYKVQACLKTTAAASAFTIAHRIRRR